MKIIVFSDLHIGDFRKFAKISEHSGLNLRMEEGFEVLDRILAYAIKHGIYHVLFSGDLLHDGSKISPPIINYMIDILDDYEERKVFLYLLHGQHDQMTQYGEWTAQRGFVHSEYKYIKESSRFQWEQTTFGDLNLVCVPYHRDIKKLKESIKFVSEHDARPDDASTLFLGHFLIKEVIEKEKLPFADSVDCISVEELPKYCDFYFIGDYHNHVYLPEHNLVSVGCAQATSFKDANYGKPCFLVYDTETKTFERVPTGAPAFWKVKASDFELNIPVGKNKEHIAKNDYIDLVVDSHDEVERLKTKYPDWSMDFDVKDQEEEKDVQVRIEVEVKTNPAEVVAKYADHMEFDLESKQLGLDILNSTYAE